MPDRDLLGRDKSDSERAFDEAMSPGQVDDIEVEHGVVDRDPVPAPDGGPESRFEIDAAFERLKVCTENPDNWAHRSRGMRCATCMFYVPKRPDNQQCLDGSIAAHVQEVGRCRRHAPVTGQGWPVMYPPDWCGDHKLDENKYPTVAKFMETEPSGRR
jgi:hypothetical protein